MLRRILLVRENFKWKTKFKEYFESYDQENQIVVEHIRTCSQHDFEKATNSYFLSEKKVEKRGDGFQMGFI